MAKILIVVECVSLNPQLLETLARAMVPEPEDWQNGCMQYTGVSQK